MTHNSFIHRSDNTISINGVRIPLEALLIFDPQYTLPTGIKSVRYTVDPQTKQGYHFQHNGSRNVRAPHPHPQLDQYIANIQSIKAIADNIQEESAEIDGLIDAMTTPYSEKRKLEYPGIDELIVALWELVVESNPKAMQRVQEIQSQRIHIKNKYPANRKNNGVDSVFGVQ
jgi:hypothetical protein